MSKHFAFCDSGKKKLHFNRHKTSKNTRTIEWEVHIYEPCLVIDNEEDLRARGIIQDQPQFIRVEYLVQFYAVLPH